MSIYEFTVKDLKFIKGSSKSLMSFRCAADFVGRLYNNHAATLVYVKECSGNMTAEDAVQMSGRNY